MKIFLKTFNLIFWIGYVHYTEKTSKFARTVARSGGPVLIACLVKEPYMYYQVYSGRELATALGAYLIPVAGGLAGGALGSAGGPAGSFVVGVIFATAGDYYKDKIKSNLKKDAVK